jgi:LytR cell envelope-related transcriptional attenuator
MTRASAGRRSVFAATDTYGALLKLPGYVSLAAVLTFVLLLLLYFSQRRDLQRLSAWMEREPDHPATDLRASEALLDRAEAELETVLGAVPETGAVADQEAVAEPTLVAPPESAPAPVTPPPASRVTAERPALERITTERAALQPHPLWHRLLRRIGQPRVLGLVAMLAVVLGIGAIFGSERLLQGDQRAGRTSKPGAIVPSEVEVAVLNGTSVPGLAGKVGDDIQVNGFKLGTISNSRTRFDQTVVMYQPGQRPAARQVAHDLGVKPVQEIDRQTEQVSGNADVVVIAGADRASP